LAWSVVVVVVGGGGRGDFLYLSVKGSIENKRERKRI
jgi:hypothetical protein